MSKVNIIAEVGANHNGDMALAKEMITAAAEAGADYVKFQSWREEDLGPGPWDSPDPFFGYKNKREFYKQAQLSDQDHYDLIDHCKSIGVNFLTTCFSKNRVGFLSELGLDTIKVASTDSTSEEMIRQLAGKFDRLIVSTGMTTMREIRDLCKWLPFYCKKHAILHCVSLYPTPLDKISIDKMLWLKENMNPVGYRSERGPGDWGVSDHSLGVSAPKVAICYGATWVEKHFTTDKNLVGPDNYMSIEPHELKQIRQFADDFAEIKKCDTLEVNDEELALREIVGDRFGDNK